MNQFNRLKYRCFEVSVEKPAARIFKKTAGRFLAFAVCLCFIAADASAAPGDLDLSFANQGFTNLTFERSARARTVMVQPDGKIIAAGVHMFSVINENGEFTLARYHPNGTLDTGFGNNGIVSTGFADIQATNVNFVDAALQGDGKIVAIGHYDKFVPEYGNVKNLLIVRYNPNGSLDLTFDGDGKLSMRIDGEISYASAIATQPNGKVVIAGTAGTAYSPMNPAKLLLVRVGDTGIDETFGIAGVVVKGISNRPVFPYAVQVQTDGKIVVAARNGNDYNWGDYVLARYHPNGTLDTGFGYNGIAVKRSGEYASYGDMALQPDGKIVTVSNVGVDFADALVLRYNADGTFDRNFGNEGRVVTAGNYGEERMTAILVQPNGKILVAGYSFDRNSSLNNNALIIRYNPNGSLDSTFGTNGIVIRPANISPYDAAFQPDGKLVTAGSGGAGIFTFQYFSVARYLLSASRTVNFDFDGDGTADFGVTRNSEANLNWYAAKNPSGTLVVETEWGLITDKIVPADYDGDRKTDVAVFRPEQGTWYILKSANNSISTVQFGQNGDVPVPSDFDGDGRADHTVFRAGDWYILNSSNNSFRAEQFGIAGDKPLMGDFDGDGRADVAVYRGGTWYAQRSTAGFFAAGFGLANDIPLPADYDGDGKTDLAVYRDGTWYLQTSAEGFKAFQFGIATDKPVPADYDADGKTNLAVFREGIWYIRKAAGDLQTVYFGYATDRPVQTAFQP